MFSLLFEDRILQYSLESNSVDGNMYHLFPGAQWYKCFIGKSGFEFWLDLNFFCTNSYSEIKKIQYSYCTEWGIQNMQTSKGRGFSQLFESVAFDQENVFSSCHLKVCQVCYFVNLLLKKIMMLYSCWWIRMCSRHPSWMPWCEKHFQLVVQP